MKEKIVALLLIMGLFLGNIGGISIQAAENNSEENIQIIEDIAEDRVNNNTIDSDASDASAYEENIDQGNPNNIDDELNDKDKEKIDFPEINDEELIETDEPGDDQTINTAPPSESDENLELEDKNFIGEEKDEIKENSEYNPCQEESTLEQNTENLEEDLKENSWRYNNGERINLEEQSREKEGFPYPWEKINGQYVNNKGEPIPYAIKKGVDVSEHNGVIDWDKAKNDGVEYAIIRCGYGSDYTYQDDDQWTRNVSECERLGIPYGVYLYSYADTLQKAESEAQHVLRLLQGHSPSLPVYYDLEDIIVEKVSSEMKGQIAQVFCNYVSAAGYNVGIYSNLYWWTYVLTDSAFNNSSWSKWVAQYNSTCDYMGEYDMWQCTGKGVVEGIGTVDLDFWIDKTSLNGLIYDESTGNWYKYQNGVVDTNYTGLVSNEKGWWYIKGGKVDWNYTGFVQNEKGWWYVRSGGIDWNYTSVEYTGSEWWYINHGKVDWNYTGLAENSKGWWYIKDGKVDWDYTGIAQNQNGVWYVKNGGVDWNCNGNVKYNGKIYSVINGHVQI